MQRFICFCIITWIFTIHRWFFDLLAGIWQALSKNHIKNRRNLLCYSGLCGMWGSNPRHAPPKIRFRNLLYFSRLTNQFTIIFAPIWDNFGTLFQTNCANFFRQISYLLSVTYIVHMRNFLRTFLPTVFPSVSNFRRSSLLISKSFAKVQNISDIRKYFTTFWDLYLIFY